MKNKLLSLLGMALIFCATLFTAAPSTAEDNSIAFERVDLAGTGVDVQAIDLNLNLNVGQEMKNAYDIAFEAMESGEPITFDISKLSLDDPEICCHPGCSLAYCCWKC